MVVLHFNFRKMKLRYLLYPFAILYGIGIFIRNFLYDSGVFSITGFEYPIISVGNLSVGGTGKTPHVEYLIQLLRENFKLATLSRGYGRKSKGFLIIKPDMPVTKAGDEPLQYKNKFPEVKVTVGEKRVPAMMSLLASFSNINAILMDDAYQHRAIKPGLSILLTDYRNLFINDHLLPVGNLRDLPFSKKRAHIIVVTKTPQNANEDSLRRIRTKINLKPNQLLFFTSLKYKNPSPVNKEFSSISIDELIHYHVLAFSGLARPGSLVGFLREKSKVLVHKRFPDHYNYSENDLKGLVKKFNQIKSADKILLTTEKDWMRIINEPHRKILDGLPVYTLAVAVDFIDPKEKEIFDRKIFNYVEKNQPSRFFNRKQDKL